MLLNFTGSDNTRLFHILKYVIKFYHNPKDTEEMKLSKDCEQWAII